MIDDGNLLGTTYAEDVFKILRLCKNRSNGMQSIVAGSTWSSVIRNLASECSQDAALVMTCAIEVVLKAKVEMVIVIISKI